MRTRAATLRNQVYIHPAEARRRFEEFARGEVLDEDLARGALLIALEEYPRLDIESYLGELDAISFRVLDRTDQGDPDVFKLGHVQAELFDTAGFQGNRESYYDVRNSYLNEVIDRKVGIPITLSVVFLHVAKRVGLTSFGVGLPGHYLVKVQFELSEVYVDPFHGGRTLTVAEIGTMLAELTKGRVTLRSEHLRQWTTRETLARVLANLDNVYSRMGDQRRAAAAKERMLLLEAQGPRP